MQNTTFRITATNFSFLLTDASFLKKKEQVSAVYNLWRFR